MWLPPPPSCFLPAPPSSVPPPHTFTPSQRGLLWFPSSPVLPCPAWHPRCLDLQEAACMGRHEGVCFAGGLCTQGIRGAGCRAGVCWLLALCSLEPPSVMLRAPHASLQRKKLRLRAAWGLAQAGEGAHICRDAEERQGGKAGRLQEACARSPETQTRVQLARKPGVSPPPVPRGQRSPGDSSKPLHAAGSVCPQFPPLHTAGGP